MKSGLKVIQDVRSLINVDEVLSLISGKIFQVKRSPGRKVVDIVIGIQGVDNEQIQQATVNVNLFVPNLPTDTTAPDLYTFDRIIDTITPLLDTQFRDSFHTDVSIPATIYEDTDGSHFANIKVNYYSIQTNFKNL